MEKFINNISPHAYMDLKIPIRITASAYILPFTKIPNKILEQRFNLDEGYIESRTGIKERRNFFTIDTNDDIYSDLINELKRTNNITNALSKPDSVIVCTDIIERQPELNLEMVKYKLGPNTQFSYTSHCPAGASAIIKAANKIHTGQANNSLILAVSKLSELVNEKNIGSSILWGDGAAGILLEKSNVGTGIINYKEHKDESLDYLPIINENNSRYCNMNGKGVARYVMSIVPSLITQCLDEANMNISNIDNFIFHQANGRMLDYLIEKLNIPKEKVPVNIDKYGNTSIASTFITYSQLRDSKILKSGMHTMFVAYGREETGKGMQADVVIYRE
jgi:3-oxoacyl-[acyl-carrier-protein] synthase III